MSKKVKTIISILVLTGVIAVGSISTALPVKVDASTVATSTVTIVQEAPSRHNTTDNLGNNYTSDGTVAVSTNTPNLQIADSTTTYERKDSTSTVTSSTTVSFNSDRNTVYKETSQSSNTKTTLESRVIIYSIDGYSFELCKGGAIVLSVPKSETTVVIPNSVKCCGNEYPVASVILSGVRDFWLMNTLVLPPGVQFMLPSDVACVNSLKNVVYTCPNNPFDTSTDYYSKMLSFGISVTKSDYSSYSEDNPDFAQVDDTINLSDDFVMENVDYNNVTYSLNSGRFATVRRIESDNNGDVKLVDYIEFNGVTFRVTYLSSPDEILAYNIKNIYLSHLMMFPRHNMFYELPNLEHVYYNSTAEAQPSFFTDGSAFWDCNISTITVVNSDDEHTVEILPTQCDVPVTSISSKTYDKTNVLSIVIVLLLSLIPISILSCRRRLRK